MTVPSQAHENTLKQSAKEIITSIVFQERWDTTDTHDTSQHHTRLSQAPDARTPVGPVSGANVYDT